MYVWAYNERNQEIARDLVKLSQVAWAQITKFDDGARRRVEDA